MVNIENILIQVIILYSMILVGIIANKINIFDENTNRVLSNFLLNITLPLYIISSFNYKYSNEILINMFIIFLLGMLFHPLCYFIGRLIFPKNNIFIFSLIFTNCGYMAFPILNSIYGQIGIIYGSVFLITFNFFLWTIGVSLFENRNNHKITIINPGIIAVIIGVILLIFQIQLPYFIKQSVGSVGSMTTPLSMIIIGSIISEMKLNDIFNNLKIYIITIIRLIIIPLSTYIILIFIPIDKAVIQIFVLLVAMPVAVTAPIFAKRYDGNTKLASQAVFISTLFSIITIPIISFIFSL